MGKNKVVIILAVLVLALLVFNIGSCINAYSQNSNRKKEMFQRMDLEEKMAKAVQENASIAAKFKELQKQLDDEKANFQAAKRALTQEQLVNDSLKEELQNLTKVKAALEEELKKETVNTKKARK
ncbi:MAG: hypothetical protein Q7K98_01900 [Candidatus Omnitrophota bacterium]|nr:hypothetical protein [Candidatus Omnitrophota bacterium]